MLVLMVLLTEVFQKLSAWVKLKSIAATKLVLSQSTLPSITDINVLYRDTDFIVVDKRYDIKINSDREGELTVATQLQHMYPELFDNKCAHGFRFIHRLDYATSGTLCIGLTRKGAAMGGKAFQERNVTKYYLALVRGFVQQGKEELHNINIAVGRDTSITEFAKMCTPFDANCEGARDAITTLALLEHGLYDGEPASKVLMQPHTGRTHQLRVHCLSLGHIIIGDYTYSNKTEIKPYRMMLHSYRLRIQMKHRRLDINTTDPLTHDVDPLWVPSVIFRTYLEAVDLIESRQTNGQGANYLGNS